MDKSFLTLYSTHSNQTERFCFLLHPCLMDIGGTQHCAVSMHWIRTKNNIHFSDRSESSGLPFSCTSVPISFLPVCYTSPLSLISHPTSRKVKRCFAFLILACKHRHVEITQIYLQAINNDNFLDIMWIYLC